MRVDFEAPLEARPRGGLAIRLPFHPSLRWGERDAFHVTGTVASRTVRGVLAAVGDAHYLELGPAWCRDAGVVPGPTVPVALWPEGPQVDTLAPDFATALVADPHARRFFDSLATFYREGYVRWVEEAKRPATRARRIAETVEALRQGRKQRR